MCASNSDDAAVTEIHDSEVENEPELPRVQTSADCTTTHDQYTPQATATAAAANTQAEQSSTTHDQSTSQATAANTQAEQSITTHDQSTSQATAANTQAERSSTFTISNTELPTITSEPQLTIVTLAHKTQETHQILNFLVLITVMIVLIVNLNYLQVVV